MCVSPPPRGRHRCTTRGRGGSTETGRKLRGTAPKRRAEAIRSRGLGIAPILACRKLRCLLHLRGSLRGTRLATRLYGGTRRVRVGGGHRGLYGPGLPRGGGLPSCRRLAAGGLLPNGLLRRFGLQEQGEAVGHLAHVLPLSAEAPHRELRRRVEQQRVAVGVAD